MKKILCACNDIFFVTEPSQVRHNAPNLTCVKYINETLLKYRDYGLDFHYELQKDNNEQCIRLDCHAYPYWRFMSAENYSIALQTYYNVDVVKWILEVRKSLMLQFAPTLKTNDIHINKRVLENYTFLVKKDLSNVSDTEAEIQSFIEETYPKLIDFLKAHIIP
ncbi:MAG: hypothetical protein IJ301_02980 [Clostridia bacterium]|nr:hypothetical protein [Clostridia bacterium]